MAINLESVRWASVTENDPQNGLPNRSTIPKEFKTSGEKRNQPIPRQWINQQFYDLYKALEDTQLQLNAITGGSSQPTLELIYPIDSVYLSFASTDPSTVLGFGTWSKIEGKFLVGVDSTDPDFDTAGETGGAKAHTHTDNFSVDGTSLSVGQLPATAPFTIDASTAGSSSTSAGTTNPFAGDDAGFRSPSSTNINWEGAGDTHTHGLSGGVQSHSNLPPFQAVYIWRRDS
jgi:hypothetical protein